MHAQGDLLVYRLYQVDRAEFVSFWMRNYTDPLEPLYIENINRLHSPPSIRALFEWKNGGKLSKAKSRSVETNYIARAAEVMALEADTPPEDFLSRFGNRGAIWGIFWLHCWQPNRYPIFDQHVWRAKEYLAKGIVAELDGYSSKQIVALYLDEYLPWWQMFSGLDPRQVDRALWTFGRFVKQWERKPVEPASTGKRQ